LLSRASVSFVAVAIALAACDSVLGLDPPTLDPCAGGCADGAVDAGLDAAADARADVAVDAKADTAAPTGVRCGGGSFPTSYCDDPTAVCCQTTDDAGTTSYTCVASTSACDGYPIACASDNDCPGSDVCCHFSTSMKCEGESTCSNADLVCDTRSADECPTGWTCDVVFTNAGQMSPYLGCSQ
jgi:hypothetical protein